MNHDRSTVQPFARVSRWDCDGLITQSVSLPGTLTGMGLTVMMSAELEDSYTDPRFSPHGTAFLTDRIILQR